MPYVDAELEGRHIFASIHPYDEEWKDRIKYDIQGSAWEPVSKRWRLPLDLATCFALREIFGKDLRVRIPLAEWASKEIAHRSELSALATADSATLELLAEEYPQLLAAMENRPYQLVGSAWMARSRNALLGDDPGLGKTLQVMGSLVEAGLSGPVLAFAPTSAAIITWPNELKKWLPDDDVTVVTHLAGHQRKKAIQRYLRTAREAYEDGRRAWLIANPEMLRIKAHRGPDERGRKERGDLLKDDKGQIITTVKYSEFFEGIKWQAAIMDESHKALITHTSRWYDQTQVRAGFTKLPIANGGLKIAMSGTPMAGKITNLWGTLNWLRPDLYTSYWKWCEQWFNVSDGYFGGKEIEGDTIETIDPAKMAGLYDSIRPVFLRRTKGEVAKDLPPKQYAGYRLDDQNPDSPPGIWLPLTGKQRILYNQLKRDAVATLTAGTMFADGPLHEINMMKKIASSAGRYKKTIYFEEIHGRKVERERQNYIPELPSNKFEWILEWLYERGMAGDEQFGESKVVIASQDTQLVNLFAGELCNYKVESFVLTGETKVQDRKAMADRFQESGGPRVFFLNTYAGGVSLTLDAADDLILIDETWIPDDQTQVEDRIHRVSRIHNVTIWYLRTLGTIEETIAKTAGGRDAIQRNLIDGQRGVEFAKKLLEEA
jgi:SNF2 family DNA or RNA helicase